MHLFGPNFEALTRKGDVQRLVRLTEDPNPATAERAATSLAGMATDALVIGINRLTGPDAERVLGLLPDALRSEVLLGLLAAGGIHLARVVQGLGRLGDVRAVEPLAALLDRNWQDDFLGPVIVKALGELGDSRATPSLRRTIRSDDPALSLSALEASARCGDVAAIDQLIAISSDPYAGRPPDPDGLPDSNAARDRASAARRLRMIGGARVVDAFVHLFDDAHNKVNQDHAYDLYQEVAAALGELGDRRAVGPLLAWVEGAYSWGEQGPDGVVDALGQLGDARAIPTLARVLARQRTARYQFTRTLRSHGSTDQPTRASERHTATALATIKAAVRETEIAAQEVPEPPGATAWVPEWGCQVCGSQGISTLDADTGAMYCTAHADRVPTWDPARQAG